MRAFFSKKKSILDFIISSLFWIFLPINIGFFLSDHSYDLGPKISDQLYYIPISLVFAFLLIFTGFIFFHKKNKTSQIPIQSLITSAIFLFIISIPYLLDNTKNQTLTMGIIFALSFLMLSIGNHLTFSLEKKQNGLEFLAIILFFQGIFSIFYPDLINLSVLGLLSLFLGINALHTVKTTKKQILLFLIVFGIILLTQQFYFILFSILLLSLHQIWLPRSKKFQKFFGLYIALLLVTIVAIWAIWENQTQIQWLEFSWHYWPSISQWFIGVGAGEYYRSWTESLTVFLNNTPALQQNHPTFLRIIIELGILGFIGFIFLLLVAIPYKERPIGTLLVIFSGIFLLPLLISTPNGILCLMTFASMRKFIKARQLKLDL